MAQIKVQYLTKIEKSRNMIHDDVYATYTSFEHDGERYFQIDTYGKPERENPDKISQSIQVNKQTAQAIVELLKREFGLS